MAKTKKQYQDEIRALVEVEIAKGDVFDKALIVGSHEFAVGVEHPELGTCYGTFKVVVKTYADSDKEDKYDGEFEASAFEQETIAKAKALAEKKATSERKKARDKAEREARKAEKSKKAEKVAEATAKATAEDEVIG